MLFNSYIFIFLFFPLVIAGYYLLNYIGKNKLALGYLAAMSMWFYGYNSLEYLIMLIISIVINYSIVAIMNKIKNKTQKRCFLILGLAVNIGILFYFKYYDFFIDNINDLFGTDYHLLKLMLPLGISFYTFQQLSYVIDSYKEECEQYSFLEYTVYVSFFPQLIAGPIVYHDELIPQLRDEKNHKINFDNLSKGIYAFALGLGKKVLIADTFSKIVTIGYANIGELSTLSVLLVMICYSLQIYFDFSGYCDMAYGIGYFFNVRLPINFNSPYKAASIVEFWERWHMTLTRFFTKYVYIPLGGNRKGEFRTYVNVFIVFLVSGIWHGANWTFIVWGMINGIGQIFHKMFGKFFEWIPRAVRVLFTFMFTTFAWSLFRANSIKQARKLWGQIKFDDLGEIYQPIIECFNDLIEVKVLYRVGFAGLINMYPWLMVAAFTVIVMLASFIMKNTQEKVAQEKYGNARIIVIVVLIFWSVLSMSDVSEFLYFNF